MLTYYTSKNSAIQLGNCIGSGGEGKIYAMFEADFPEHCAKIYHFKRAQPEQIQAQERKIQYLVNAAPPIYLAAHQKLKACWPLELLYCQPDKTDFAGFIMPLAYENSVQLYKLTSPTQTLPATWNVYKAEETQLEARLRLCARIAAGISKIHGARRYVFVDLNPRNILITPEGHLAIIDTDSMQIKRGQTFFRGPVTTPEYRPPESQTIVNPQAGVLISWDLFPLAVIFYEILLGLHPYAGTGKPPYDTQNTIGRNIKNGLFAQGANKEKMAVIPPPHLKFDRLPEPIQELFKKAFDAGTKNPAHRPDANQWGATIIRVLSVVEQPPDPKSSEPQLPNINLSAPQPLMPQPLVPQPLVPQPLVPQLLVPQPLVPQPLVPQPLMPQPLVPKPLVPKWVVELIITAIAGIGFIGMTIQIMMH